MESIGAWCRKGQGGGEATSLATLDLPYLSDGFEHMVRDHL